MARELGLFYFTGDWCSRAMYVDGCRLLGFVRDSINFRRKPDQLRRLSNDIREVNVCLIEDDI